MTSRFSRLPPVSPDPVFELMRLAQAAGKDGVDASVGMILDEEGLPRTMACVRQAAREWAEEGLAATLPYPPLLGLPGFRAAAERLLFGEEREHLASLATTGGTGALAMNLLLLKAMDPDVSVIIPTPTWGNHLHLCHTLGVRPVLCAYLSPDGRADTDGIAAALETTTGPKALLVQADCHNPTGKDLTDTQWTELAELCERHDATILLDFPYQGFAGTPEHDARIVRLLREHDVALLIAWSGSKNHAMYGLRAGCAVAAGRDEAEQRLLSDRYAVLTRGVHSAAATAGQWLIARIHERHADAWGQELAACREDIDVKRAALREMLPGVCADALDGHGLFALLPLGKERVRSLREEKKIFLTGDGRVNIAGLRKGSLERFAEGIRWAMES